MELKATIFEFTSYKFEPENKKVVFNYKQEFQDSESLTFTETLVLPDGFDLSTSSKDLIDKILQGVHLIIGISYYKFYCAPIVRHNYLISKEEANFWNTVYKKGLGEFYFRNSLDPKISPKFEYKKEIKSKNFRIEKNNKCFVCVSGGKDSIVATELLKEQNFDVSAIFTETQHESKIVNKVIEELGIESMKFRRILDPKINQNHKYDGHVPVSAMFAFLGIFYSVLYKRSYCILANEHSSNFGNVKYKGNIVNHQWSKSSEFENMFSNYVKDSITPDVKYFSLLRPFYEIRILEMFSKYKKYFPYFSSCNKNFRVKENESEGLWCGECPKCAFAFILFSAFLPKEEILNIFKKNLYQDEKLLPLFKAILGFGKMKPFDCVGTFGESKLAFSMGANKFKSDFIVRQLLPCVKIEKGDKEEFFSAKFSTNIPDQFKFLGMKNVLILGHGKEGKISKKYIENKYPNLKIGVADKKQGKNYLEKQHNYDIAIKTPGISKRLLTIQYTTATNIFFSEINKMGNKIIGVTGSKGKSTTSMLIYSILKEANKNVKILGNIGEPMLENVLTKISKDYIFVLELSSYQLDDINFSPDIAVVTNLFPEHMDYHLGVKNYYEAKKNIISFQDKNGVFVYNSKEKELAKWASQYKNRLVDVKKLNFLEVTNSKLLGEHNSNNILLAVDVAKEFGISDQIIKTAIEKFQPLTHRLEFVGEFSGIKFFDDAISTTPESTIAAIVALKDVDTIFLGGEDRGYDFKKLEKIIQKYKIRNVILFPDSGNKIKVKGLNVLKTKSMKDAVKFAYKNTEKGKICLLSCASPSYSLWKNFEEKGDQFKKYIRKNNTSV